MVERMWIYLLVVLMHHASTEDPCKSRLSFTHLEKRSPTYKRTAGEDPLSDRYDLDEKWYGDIGVAMPTTESPEMEHCGTKYPVYLKEGVPDSELEETATACIHTETSECDLAFEIKTKRCEALNSYFYIYYLKRLPLIDSAYCAGLTGGEYPEYKTEVVTKVELQRAPNRLVFYCEFQQSTGTLWYSVSWYVHDALIHMSKPLKGPATTIREDSRLEEKTLGENGIKTVGFKVKCAVRASYQENSTMSLPSFGESKFIGIEILTPSIEVAEDKIAEIKVRPTAPIGCLEDALSCRLDINTLYPSTSCDPRAAFESTRCLLKIDGFNWNQTFTMKAKDATKLVYGNGFLLHLIKLKTIDAFRSHGIWGNSTIGDVQIYIKTDTRSIEGKECKSVSDPHLTTFQNRGFEHQYSGTHTLYENKRWQQEVQFTTRQCGGTVYCICGVAVRAGREVFILNVCNGQLAFQFALCDDESNHLNVAKNGSVYKIYFPSGTLIDLSYFTGSRVINVNMFPSIEDVEVSRGLCGNVNRHNRNDAYELYLRDGQLAPNLNDFSVSWKVSGTVPNLFSKSTLDGLDHSSHPRYYCDCDSKSESDENIIECSKDCEIIGPGDRVPCKVHNVKKKRSVSKFLFNDNVQEEEHMEQRVKRSADNTWRNDWTEEKAKEYCTSLFNNSTAVQICKEIPTVDLEIPLNNCMLDIKYMGDASFSMMAVESIKTQCYQEVNANTTLRSAIEPGKPSIFEQVKEVACPNECSSSGDCIKGICKCEENYGGVDCSVDIRDPPIMYHLSEDGYCDLSDDECSEVSVFGEIFVETENTSCRISKMEMAENGIVVAVDETVETPYLESIAEAICTLPSQRKRRAPLKPEMEFVQIYNVAVSNNGIAYSNESVMVIFNSRCQYCTINGLDVKCSYTGDFCMSGGLCYENGEPHISHKCYVCSVNGGSRSWTSTTTPECQIEPDEKHQPTKEEPLWLVGAVLGIVALICISVFAVWFITSKSKRKVAASPLGSKVVINGPPPYSTKGQ